MGPLVPPAHAGADIVYLGTPQTEESIYNRLVIEQDYDCFCLPARVPLAVKLAGYALRRNDGLTRSPSSILGSLRRWRPAASGLVNLRLLGPEEVMNWCIPLARSWGLGAHRVLPRDRRAGTGAGRALSARRSSRHRWYALTS